MKASCRNCFFFHPEVNPNASGLFSNVEYGECRKGRPVANFTEFDVRERVFPIVRLEDWCGEWRSEEGDVLG